ncbi:GIY-YIG nuclease family protein [Verrucomicrobiales bacterium]|jgi:hypothetical protein|nr:GIY-YIG nuclease family protein [Verrucomicrobiales bacterium]
MTRGKTIQLFLPDGNPRGVKIAEFTSRTIQSVLIPRAQLEFACTREELRNVGIYFLFAEGTSGSLPLLYVGEAEDCATRLKQHNKQKDWWTVAIVCISKTAEFTKSHVKFLEWHCHQQAGEAGRFKLENSSTPTKSHVSESMEADLMDHFDTIRTLASTLGYPLFDRIKKAKTKDKLTCKGKKALATGEYADDGVVVFAGSIANREFTKSSHEYIKATSEGLLEDGVLAPIDADTLRFTKDHVFPSPSQAAAIVLARTANGWIEWKYEDGKTLDEVKRRDDETS